MGLHDPHHRRHRSHPSMHLPDPIIDGNTSQPYRVFHAMRSVMRAQMQLMTRKLGQKDAHMGQAFTLWMLSEHEGMSPSNLADLLNVRRPTVTIMLRKMEKAGLIERRADEQDQRSVRIYLTDAGRSLHSELEAVHAAVVETTVDGISVEDQRELERLLRRVEENLNAALEEHQDGAGE